MSVVMLGMEIRVSFLIDNFFINYRLNGKRFSLEFEYFVYVDIFKV